MTSFEVIEGGLATALCDASEHQKRPDDIVVAYIPAPGGYSSFPPAPSSQRPPPLVSSDGRGEIPAPGLEGAPVVSSASEPKQEAPSEGAVPRPSVGASTKPLPLSFAELWPEGEQTMVRELEDAIAFGRYWRAIELCEVLVSRTFANTAGLLGALEAPREAAMVPLLLGLEGRRYLAFRAVVREARGDGLITSSDALLAYAFAIEARIARSSVR
jgi:hypothetical protein